MGMFFNSWKDDDVAYYYESLGASDHYYRGYDDGRDSAEEKYKNKIDKAYKKGYEAGRKKAIEELMKNLIDLFGDDIKIAYLDIIKETARNKLQKYLEDNASDSEPSVKDDSYEPVCDDSLDDSISNQESNDDVVSELNIENNYPIK